MDRKIKFLAVASLVAVMASGCSSNSYRGASQAGVNAGANTKSVGAYAGGQVARTGQVARRGFGQQGSNTAAVANDSCAVCAASKAQNTYTYKPATKPVVQAPRPAVVQRPVVRQQTVQTGQHNQQYYIDRWNRQQQQQQQRPAPRPVQQQQPQQQQNYAGYGQNNTTYVDYSSAARTTTPAPAVSSATSNKSIYTGSYQQKTYTPTTYSGGSSATTNSGSAYANAKAAVASTSTGGSGSTYSVKKGDTVFEIMRQTGVYWKDIISMNNLSPPYAISPGQTLRLK